MRTLLSAALLAPALGLVAPARRRSSRGATRRLAFDAALLFDCDGVLVETEELHRLAYNEAFAAFGLETAGAPVEWSVAYYDKLQNTVGGGKPKMKYHFTETAKEWPTVSGRGGRATATTLEEGMALIDDLQDYKTECYKRLVATTATARPGALELMDDAIRTPGLAVGICSASTRGGFEKVVDAIVGQERLARLDVVIAGDDVTHKKPDPEIYNLAAARLGVDGPGANWRTGDARGLRRPRLAEIGVRASRPASSTADTSTSAARAPTPRAVHAAAAGVTADMAQAAARRRPDARHRDAGGERLVVAGALACARGARLGAPPAARRRARVARASPSAAAAAVARGRAPCELRPSSRPRGVVGERALGERALARAAERSPPPSARRRGAGARVVAREAPEKRTRAPPTSARSTHERPCVGPGVQRATRSTAPGSGQGPSSSFRAVALAPGRRRRAPAADEGERSVSASSRR